MKAERGAFELSLEGVEGIRVLVVDDDSLARRALTFLLSHAPGLSVVGEAGDGVEAVDSVRTLQPDVVVTDVQMPRIDGIEVTVRIATNWPSTRVLAVTTVATIDTIVAMLRAGASGYLLKDTDPDTIVDSVRQVHAGIHVLSPRVAHRLVASVRDIGAVSSPTLGESEKLSEREQQVVEHLAAGKSNAEIARALFISQGTVKAHLGNVMMKWNARDRVQVLIRASRAGLVSL